VSKDNEMDDVERIDLVHGSVQFSFGLGRLDELDESVVSLGSTRKLKEKYLK